MQLQFLGANQQVTGSRYHLQAGGLSLLIDCGLFQERSCLHRNWDPSPISPDQIDFCLLTHAHLDHCGLLPKLVGEGYRNPILTNPASIELARIVLEDSARIQKEDAIYKRKRHQKEGRRGPHPEVPLYTSKEVKATMPLFQMVPYGKKVSLNKKVDVCFHDAGHILGSAMLELTVQEGGKTKRLLFSGDIGQTQRPLMHDPTHFEKADYVVMESTYGDRNHESQDDFLSELADIINQTVDRGGNLVIPTFAIDRAQALLFYLSQLANQKRIPRLTVFLDSPMAINATKVYKQYISYLDQEIQTLLKKGRHPFQFPGMHYVRTSGESRSINSIRGSCIILAGSGMCTGGRIKHHLRHNISRPESTILFSGYQAQNTLGRCILDGDQEVRIHGKLHTVRAKIQRLYGLSAHADRQDLFDWLAHFHRPLKRLFLTHGEAEVSEKLAIEIQKDKGWKVQVPAYQEVVQLD